jgi:hypothetical protein
VAPSRTVTSISLFVSYYVDKMDSAATMLPDAGAVTVRRDGESFGAWRGLSAREIELDAVIDAHRYEIHNGYRGADSVRAPATILSNSGPGTTRRRRASTPTDILSATHAVASGAASCPCCARRCMKRNTRNRGSLAR